MVSGARSVLDKGEVSLNRMFYQVILYAIKSWK